MPALRPTRVRAGSRGTRVCELVHGDSDKAGNNRPLVPAFSHKGRYVYPERSIIDNVAQVVQDGFAAKRRMDGPGTGP